MFCDNPNAYVKILLAFCRGNQFHAKGLSILLFFTRTLAYAHSRTRSFAKYTLFDSYAYTDVRRIGFVPNCNISPGLAGPVGSSYEDYSMTKDTEEKLIEVR